MIVIGTNADKKRDANQNQPETNPPAITEAITESETAIIETTIVEPETESDTESETETETESGTIEETETEGPKSDDSKINAVCETLKSIAQDYYDEVDVKYDADSSTYTITYCVYGLCEDVILSGDKDGWNELVAETEKTCKAYSDEIQASDPDKHVAFTLLNDQNLDNSLLLVLDGVTIYNFME